MRDVNYGGTPDAKSPPRNEATNIQIVMNGGLAARTIEVLLNEANKTPLSQADLSDLERAKPFMNELMEVLANQFRDITRIGGEVIFP